MTTRAVNRLQVTWKDAVRILPLGVVLGACYGMFFGWSTSGYAGLLTLAVLERAAKTGIAVAAGLYATGKIAGRLATSSLCGAIVGVVVAGVYDQPPLSLLCSIVISACLFGILSRLGLFPGESTWPTEMVNSDKSSLHLCDGPGPSQTDTLET